MCTRRRAGANVLGAGLLGAGLLAAGCGPEGAAPRKSEETIAAEARAGDFIDYYAQVLRLAQTHSAQPDSFRAALDSLPGTHLDDAAWNAWVRPSLDDPRRFTDRLEEVIAESKPRPAKVTAP